jgi:peroxiredoxin
MTIEAGARAPDFSLRGIDGEMYSLSDALSRGPIVLVFFKTTCGTCDLAFPYINRLLDAYPGDDWSLWAVAQDPPAEASHYAATYGMSYPVLPDVDGYAASKAYDPLATPTLFLIDRAGDVVQETAGFSKADLNSLAAALAERLTAELAVIAPAGDGNPDSRPG